MARLSMHFLLACLLAVALSISSTYAFVPKTALTRLPLSSSSSCKVTRRQPHQPLRALPETAADFTTSSPLLVADYFSTVDEIAASIGNTPWLQYFIPTAVGMSIALAIVFSLYITAQPYEPPENN